MKNWKFVKTGNGISLSGFGGEIPPESELSKEIYSELKNNGFDKDKVVLSLAVKYKSIPNARGFFESAVEKVMKSYSSRTVNESIDKQTWSMFKGLSKDAEKEVGNADLPTEQDLKNWIRMMEQDKKEAQREMDKWKHHTEGQYSGDQFNTAMVKYNEAVSQIKKMQEELRQGKYKKVGNESIGDEYNAEIYRLEKKKMDLERMGQGQKAREIEKQIQQLQKELREYDIGNKKTGNETAEEKKFGKVMREFDRGELKSSSGETVTNPEQAKAIAYSESEKVDNLKRARNAMTKNAMGISDLEAQIKKNEDYIKSLQGKTVDSEGWSAKASIQEAQDEIDRMKSRIEELKKQGNKKG